MSTEANGSSLLLPPPPQSIAEHVSAPVPSPSPAPPVASTVHSPSAEAAAAAVAAIHADALAAQAHAHAKARAEAAIEAQAQAHIQNDIHQQQQNHHESASASPNPLKRSLEPNQEEDSARLKVARLENEHFDVSHNNSPTATPAEANGTHSADPPADVQTHQQEQQQTHQHTAESHFQAQPQPQSVENQQPIHPHVPSHTSTPVPPSDSTAHEIPHGPNQHQQAQHQQVPQSQAQHEHVRNLTPDEQQEVMRLIDTDVAARAIEASAANAVAAAVTSAAPTAPMDTQATQINVPASSTQAAETANAISQSQAQQAMASVPVNANSASLDVNVDNVHAAVAIHEAGKPQANMSYPGPQLQPGPGPLSLPHTPSRPMNFPLASPQVGTEKPYGCAHCDMSFRRLHDLKRHSKLHTGEKPHVCPKCERKFARGDALARHSKGVGGCAARRTSMNTFVDTNDLDNHGLLTGEAPAMGSIVYSQPDDRSAIAPPDARFHPTPESQFSDSRISSLQLQPSRDSTAAAATTATTTPVYSTVGISTNTKDLDEANAGVQSTAEVQRTSDLGLARPSEDAGAEDKTRAGTAGSAVSLASPAPNSTATTAPAPTLASPAATTTATATTTTTTADPSLNMFTSGNAAIWTYIISLEARLATLEKTDREKSDQIAAMEKHISLIAAQLSAPKE